MPAFNVGVNSTFEQQRQVINSIAVDVDQLKTNFDSVTSDGLVVIYSETSGVATVSGYATSAGIATYATSAGVSTYATLAGISTYAGLAGVATYAGLAGVATNADYATIAGSAAFATVAAAATNADYATQAGEAAFAPLTGISTYAGVAGIATVAEGLTGSPNIIVGVATANLFVGDGSELLGVAASTARDLTGSPDITVTNITSQHLVASGVVTATQFVGDGSGLTNITAAGTGIVIQEEGSSVGTASTLNFVGTGVTASISNGVATIQSSTDLENDPTPRLGANLDVWNYTITTGITDGNVRLQGNGTGDVEIGGTATITSVNPLTLGGSKGILIPGTSQLSTATVSAAATFSGDVHLNTTVADSGIFFDQDAASLTFKDNHTLIFGTDGIDGAIYSGTYYGVTGVHFRGTSTTKDLYRWGNFIVGTTSQQNARLAVFKERWTDGFGTDGGVELHYQDGGGSYNSAKRLETTSSGVTVTGTVSATSFSGDGSGLTGVVAEGSGVVIQDDGVNVGTALTINFGDYLSVSSVIAGIVTVTGQQGGVTSPGLFEGTDGVGIGTISKVGIGTTVPTEFLTVKGGSATIDGFVSAGSTVYGSGVKLTGINTSLVGTGGSVGDIKMILGYPFYHDGVAWREFYLKEGALITESADADWDSVIFRNDFNESFTDQSQYQKNANVTSNVDLVASPVKFGSKAIRMRDGQLRYNHSSQYVFTGAWTIEFWVYFDSLPDGVGNQSDALVSKTYSAFSGDNWFLGAEQDAGTLTFYWKNNNRSGYAGASGVPIGVYTSSTFLKQWHHVALVRESENGSIHFYLDGVESIYTDDDEITDNDIIDSTNADLHFGYGYNSSSDIRRFDGILDDIRISTIARYTSNFTPPTAAYPLTGTVSGPYDPPAQGAVSQLDDLSDVTGTPSTGQVLKYNGTNWAPASDLTNLTGAPGIGLTDLSVTTNPVGTNALVYNDTTGTFTFTPTSLVGYATETYVNNAVAGIATVGYVDDAIVGFITDGASGAGLISLTGASAGTYGDNGNSARITVDARGRITNITQVAITTDGAGVNVSGISTFNDNVSFGSTIIVDGSVQLTGINTSLVTTEGVAGDIKLIAGAPFFHDGTSWREFALTSGATVTNPEDPYWNSVIFRAPFDNSYTDLKFSLNPTSFTGISTVASPVKFGTTALRMQDGLLRYNHRSQYVFSGEWTIEFWVYFDSLPDGFGNQSDVLVSKSYTSVSTDNWFLGATNDAGTLTFYWKNNSHPSYQGVNGVSIGSYTSTSMSQQWHHVALVREPENGSIHFYLDGSESSSTSSDQIIDNDIIDNVNADLYFGYGHNGSSDVRRFDGVIDDARITTKALYTSNFTPPTAALPTSGTPAVSYEPPGDKYGEIVLGGVPTWTGTSGVTPSQVVDGTYRLTFSTSYSNPNDYIVLVQPMDQGFSSYVGVARSTTHVDVSITRQSNNSAVDTGSLAVQISNK
jgi:hypothetical protein